LKILFLNRNLTLGGGERLITNLAKYSVKEDSNVFDFALIENRVDFGDLDSLNIYPLTKGTRIEGVKRLVYLPVILYKLLSIGHYYDYLVSFERVPAYLNLITSIILNKPFVVYIINPLSASFVLIYRNRLFRNLHVMLHKIVFNRAAHILTMSDGIKRELVHTYSVSHGKIHTIYPSIDTKLIENYIKQPIDKCENKFFENKEIVINIGRLHQQKNQSALIMAFNSITEEFPNLNLFIIGEGPERNNLKNLIKSLKLEERVFLLGGKSNPYKYLARSKIFVLPSFFEGVPSVILEAMYCGIPVIAVDSPFGLREILAPELDYSQKIHQIRIGKFGILIPNSQSMIVSGIAQSISFLLKKSGIKSVCKRKIICWSQNFSVKEVHAKWKSVLV